jgi:hypothetical protein
MEEAKEELRRIAGNKAARRGASATESIKLFISTRLVKLNIVPNIIERA